MSAELVIAQRKGRGRRKHAPVALAGAMTIYQAVQGKALLLGALDAAPADLEIDLSGVLEIDSAGLQLLAMVKREAASRGKGVRLVAHSPAVAEVFDCYRLPPDLA
jgi:anti-sigma B factor antagonist